MTIAERRRQQFFRSKLNEEVEEQNMTNEDRSQIAVLAARFAENTNDIMALAEAIENAIDAKLARLIAEKKVEIWHRERWGPCEKY